jgi:hypothetical protein
MQLVGCRCKQQGGWQPTADFFRKPVRLVGLSESVQLVGLSVRFVGWQLWRVKPAKSAQLQQLKQPNRVR